MFATLSAEHSAHCLKEPSKSASNSEPVEREDGRAVFKAPNRHRQHLDTALRAPRLNPQKSHLASFKCHESLLIENRFYLAISNF